MATRRFHNGEPLAAARLLPAHGPSTSAEPHQVSAAMSRDAAERIFGLLERTSEPEIQGKLNGLARQYRLATPEADAATVNRRLREAAQGVRQAANRWPEVYA